MWSSCLLVTTRGAALLYILANSYNTCVKVLFLCRSSRNSTSSLVVEKRKEGSRFSLGWRSKKE
jgi:hypothetical protein